jgi:hypothetical protein
LGDPHDVTATLNDSYTIDPKDWIRRRIELDSQYCHVEDGEWPQRAPSQPGIVTHQDYRTGQPKREVFIVLLPVAAPWETFAYLNWGGWNACPYPAEHCAIHRWWAQDYGAEVVSITGDIVQCAIARPPNDRGAALSLAREQYWYCEDIVDQGVGTIAAHAASLLGARHWYFWWD